MVSNLIISPVSLGFIVVHECFSEHGIFSMESVTAMLTDTKLRNLKPQEKLYKVNDRDGLYVAVTAAGSISFRYNYSINGRQPRHRLRQVHAYYISKQLALRGRYSETSPSVLLMAKPLCG